MRYYGAALLERADKSRSRDRFWVEYRQVYNVKVSAKGNGKFRLSEDGASYVNAMQNMLLWDPAGKSWSVEQRHLRCTGFSRSR